MVRVESEQYWDPAQLSRHVLIDRTREYLEIIVKTNIKERNAEAIVP